MFITRSRDTSLRKGVTLLAMVGVLLALSLGFSQESEFTKRMAEFSDRLAFASKGQVLGVKGEQVYLDMGEQTGVVEGTTLEVVRLGDPLVVGGRVVGHEETIIGEVEIVRVREGIAIAKVVKQGQPFEKGDRAYQLKKKVQRVAIAEFPYGDAFNDLTKNVQDMLYTALIQKGMNVVERQKLEEVLREQKIAYTGIIDLATATQVGKLLGVEGVVVGSVADLGNAVAITARLIDVEKGTSITAARMELPKTTEIATLLGKGGRRMMAQEPVGPSGSAGPSLPPKSTTPTAQHLTDGEDLFFDDFSRDAQQWLVLGSEAKVIDGMFAVIGRPLVIGLAGSQTWRNYSVKAKVKLVSNYTDFGILVASNKDCNFYHVQFFRDKVDLLRTGGKGCLQGYSWEVLDSNRYSIKRGQWLDIRVDFQDVTITGYVNDSRVISVEDAFYTQGMVGLRAHRTQIFVDDFKVVPLAGP